MSEYLKEITLINRDSKGKLRVAIISYKWDDDKHGYVIHRTTGTYQGKLTEQPEILIQKGKAKRSVTDQCKLEFNSHVKKYCDKGYKELENNINTYTNDELNEIVGSDITNSYGVIKPQLAKQIDKVTNLNIFNKKWYASRKIDGIRCLWYFKDGVVHTSSRGGENYDHSTTFLRENPKLIEFFTNHPTIILDTELYKHGLSLQTLSGMARLEKDTLGMDVLEAYIYDIVDTSKTFEERLIILNEIKNELNLSFDPYKEWDNEDLRFQFVPHEITESYEEIECLHNIYVSEGFEGVVVRDPNKEYKPNGRTNAMIKVKKYKSSEFKVIGIKQGLRIYQDMVFILETEEGKQFEATPYGTIEQKKEYTENFDKKYKGHMGECKYFYMSDDNIPLQPNFKIFRFDLE